MSRSRAESMGDDIHEPLRDIRARIAGSTIGAQLVNIQAVNVPQQKSLEFLENLNCLFFTDGDLYDADTSTQPLLKSEVIDAFGPTKYVALSYTWKPPPEDSNAPSEGYWVEDIQTGKKEPSTVRDIVFTRMRRYMNRVDAKYLWIDKHCIQQEGEPKQIGIQAMDRVYSLSEHPVALLSRRIKTMNQLYLLDEILSEDLVSARANLDRVREAFRLLHYITSDTWFSRAWTFQENYRANSSMTLLITHSMGLNYNERFQQFVCLDGELYINSATFHEQATKLCLAYSNPQLRIQHRANILSRAQRYAVTLQGDDGSAPSSMSPTIIEDISKREIEKGWDRLAIIANCCQYTKRVNSDKLHHSNASLSLSLLALCLMNGEILSNHPEGEIDVESARAMPITEFLKKHFFYGLEAPWPEAKLTFNKSCRFSNIVLSEEGVKTKGYLWQLDDLISTMDFHEIQRYRKPYKRPLQWLAKRLYRKHRFLSKKLYKILKLYEASTAAEEWQLSMANKVEEAIEEGKDLRTAILPGTGPLGVAIFVLQPEENGSDSSERGESSEEGSEMSLDQEDGEERYVFTSFQAAKFHRQSFDLNDLNKHVSLEVDLARKKPNDRDLGSDLLCRSDP
ncbi:hypothetical protein F53441_3611 [Fusarium austroafricanum]|uniref:Heterokaryon incompatibility domain-containing protein n=1 Tax=Fusarium austroafricanum TaxID=2364996 RepID=A0A8H4KPE1_9HYPO|nr:hypothetical protein F53441_3611 [Fusarium austroafricanum]